MLKELIKQQVEVALVDHEHNIDVHGSDIDTKTFQIVDQTTNKIINLVMESLLSFLRQVYHDSPPNKEKELG